MKSDIFADEANYFWLTPGPVELQTFCVNFKYTLPHPVIWKTPTFLTNFQTFKDWRQFKIRRVYFRNFEGNCTSEKKWKRIQLPLKQEVKSCESMFLQKWNENQYCLVSDWDCQVWTSKNNENNLRHNWEQESNKQPGNECVREDEVKINFYNFYSVFTGL